MFPLLSLLRPLRSRAGLAVSASLAALAASCTERFPRPFDPPPSEQRLDARPTNATCIARAVPPGRVALEPAFTGFRRPLAMVDRPDLGVVYVAEMPGTIKVVDRQTGAVSVALELVGKVGTYFEQGLLGLAIHPTKPYAYVTVERDADGTTLPELPHRAEILRFAIDPGNKTFDAASETLVLRLDRPTTLHYPGTLAFGPDGKLYVGVGDGGASLDTTYTRWTPDIILGTILRLDVDAAEPYAIPPDNPWAGGGGRGEIWAGGLRNPWRFTFDRVTGEMWGGDVGEISFEEVNKIERGKNYGWPTLEGPSCFRPREGCDARDLEAPVYAYPHAEGASVTGGYVYRGTAMPELVGKYVFGDYAVGRIWALEGAPGSYRAELLNPGGLRPSVSSFGEDADGELYALDWESGTIFKLVAGSGAISPPIYPPLLSQTGCVDAADPRVPAAGLVPYDVNVELWSDGADKTRHIAIPDGTVVRVEDDGDMTLPEGSVLVKTFSTGGRRIETRLLMRHPGGEWTGASYEWNDDESDATLLDSGKDKTLSNGQTWSFPSPAQCFVCHTKGAGTTLGLEAAQLDRSTRYSAVHVDNQLSVLSAIGYLDRPIASGTWPRLPALGGGAPLEDRARAYLHANCSMCHRKDTGTGARLDLRYGLPLEAIDGCGLAEVRGEIMPVLSPGDPERSALFARLTARDAYQMPPIATHLPDDVAADVVGSWIRQLPACK